jgi:hypothetical protein
MGCSERQRTKVGNGDWETVDLARNFEIIAIFPLV